MNSKKGWALAGSLSLKRIVVVGLIVVMGLVPFATAADALPYDDKHVPNSFATNSIVLPSGEKTLVNRTGDSASVAIHKQVDVFGESFSRKSVNVVAGQSFEVCFSIRPVMDAPNVRISFVMPSDLVRLVSGPEVWTGNVKKNENVSLKLTFATVGEVDAYVRAQVEALLYGDEYCVSCYLHVSSLGQPLNSQQTSVGRISSSVSHIDSATGYITISGRFVYVNEVGGISPMRQVLVYLMDADFPLDETVASQYTDYNGNFYFHVVNDDGWLQGGRDPYVRVQSSNPAASCGSGPGLVYAVATPKAGNDVADGFYYNYGTMFPVSANEAWQAIDACLSERDWIYSRTSPAWQRTTAVSIWWPWSDWPAYVPVLDSIWLPTKDIWPWDHTVLQHEYAHAVMQSLYLLLPAGQGPDPHYIFSESSGGFALVEGWAEFLECAVDNNPGNLQGWHNGHGGNIETNDWFNCMDSGDMDGAVVEGSVASIFWDILDPASTTDNDYLSLDFDEIFTVLRYDKPNSIEEFWGKWVIRWPAVQTSSGPLCNVYWHYGIDKDDFPPHSGFISINGGADYATSTSVTLTLSCSDWGSGVTQMRFRNSLTDPWSSWHTFSTSKSWTLSVGDGVKYVYAEFMDLKGQTSPTYYDTITLTSASTYSATINAACYTEAELVAIPITMDGSPAGYNTPHTFASLAGSHTFTVPSTDALGHPFKQWSNGGTSTTITVTGTGTYIALYEQPTAGPTFEIWTNKASYTVGESMTVYVQVVNPGPATAVRATIKLGLAGGGTYGPLLDLTTTLPPGFDSGTVTWNTFVLPAVPAGTYSWIAELRNPTTNALIDSDTWTWTLT